MLGIIYSMAIYVAPLLGTFIAGYYVGRLIEIIQEAPKLSRSIEIKIALGINEWETSEHFLMHYLMERVERQHFLTRWLFVCVAGFLLHIRCLLNKFRYWQ